MNLPKQIMRFIVVGGTATVIDFVILWGLHHQLEVHYLVATAIAFVLATIFNYWASMKFVFRGKSNRSKKREFILFVVLSILGLLLTIMLMKLAVSGVGLSVMPSRILVTTVVMTFNFVTRKWLLEDNSTL